jgi:hypothetical protein
MKRNVRVASLVLVLMGVSSAAVAVPSAGASEVIYFTAAVKAQTTLATLNQTVVVPPGTFKGTIRSGSSNVGHVKGNLKLPPATTTMSLAGIGLATVTVQMVATKPTVGTLNPTNFAITATSTFNIDVTSVKPLSLPVNVVGKRCATSTPVRLTFSGTISPLSGGTASGTYTIPSFAHCGAATVALDTVVSGPGNTFSAKLIPTGFS